jgi:hypothetical protein
MMGEVTDWSRFDPLAIARNTVAKAVRALDVDVLDPARAEQLVDVFAEIERLGAAGKALAAKRVTDAERWRLSGEPSAADWLAKKTGSSVGAARGALEAAASVAPGSKLDEALRSGALSMPQAEAVAAAVAADPSAEDDLLARASVQPLAKLKDDCARVRAAATDEAARHARIHRRRSFRAWTDADGARCGMWKLTPELGAEVERALKPFADAAFEAARRAGEREPAEAYAADGIVAMARAVSGGDAPVRERKRRRREAIVLVNLESLQRGSVASGELCEIPGVGPVPVDVARDLLGDALLRIVITDGVDVLTAVHAGRLASDVQRTAIQVRQRGRCLRPPCSHGIDQIDHVTGFCVTGAVTLDDLGGLCAFDHALKTNHGHVYRHGDRGWEWHRPDGVIEYERPPP